jgi:hypothetical protein
VPAVTLLTTNQFGGAGRLHWGRNFMHNLVRECCITFNDLVAERFDSYFLDFWAAFTTPASKQFGYDNMIGNFDLLVAPQPQGVTIPSRHLNLPLPFFFTRDTGIALPTAALPYNEMRINFSMRPWQELLVLENSNPSKTANIVTPLIPGDIAVAPELTDVQVWADYAIVSNEERKQMACAPRDILIEQVQTAPRQAFNPLTNMMHHYDIRFSHAIKALFFAARNTTHPNVRSNYTSASPIPGPAVDNYTPSNAFDPLATISLIYESTNRLGDMGADYYSLINPWYHAPTIPSVTGMHLYSYSLRFFDVDPLGSTNYGKLTNVTIAPKASQAAVLAAGGTAPAGSGADYTQTFEFVTVAINSNVIRISGGACGFPVLRVLSEGTTADSKAALVSSAQMLVMLDLGSGPRQFIIDSGASLSVVKSCMLPTMRHTAPERSVNLVSAFGDVTVAALLDVTASLVGQDVVGGCIPLTVARTDKLVGDVGVLSLADFERLRTLGRA